jgi:hypothetical protein
MAQKNTLGIGFGKIVNEEVRKRNGADGKTPSKFEYVNALRLISSCAI